MEALLATTRKVLDVGEMRTSQLAMVVAELIATLIAKTILPVVCETTGIANRNGHESTWDGLGDGLGL